MRTCQVMCNSTDADADVHDAASENGLLCLLQSISPSVFRYPIPEKIYQEFGVRRYGFHGSSHQFVVGEATKLLEQKGLQSEKLISAHLGAGCSLAACVKGRSVDTRVVQFHNQYTCLLLYP